MRDLIRKFEILPKVTRNTTIFDVAGFPYYENVNSNILAFYLDPSNEHGLKDLFLSSMMSVLDGENRYGDYSDNVDVRREVYTDKGGRLDLVITTGSQIIGIENKIYHQLNNDLKDYSCTLHSLAKSEGLGVTKVILSIRKEKESEGFQSITYRQYLDAIRSNIGNYVTTASAKWLQFAIEFINSIDSIIGEKDMVITEEDKFYIDNEDKIEEILKGRKQFLNKLSKRLESLELVVIKPNHCQLMRTWNKSSLFCDFMVDGHKIATEMYIKPSGWELHLHTREKTSKAYLREVASLPIMCEKVKKLIDDRYLLSVFTLDADIETIANSFNEWNQRLNEVVEAKAE